MNYFGLSDKGRYRSENQDAFALSPVEGGVLAVVCDGMGGAAAGALAGRMAKENFLSFAGAALASGGGEEEDILREAANAANRAIYDFAGGASEYAGMGTTLVGGIFRADRAVLVHVGDSRAYRAAGDGIVQLTKDHSLVQHLVDIGEITPEEARRHPSRNIITRAVGSEAFVVSDTMTVPVRPGDVFLLCTDGLTNAVEDEAIRRLITDAPDAESACRALVEAALQNNTRDNVTAAVIDLREGGQAHE